METCADRLAGIVFALVSFIGFTANADGGLRPVSVSDDGTHFQTDDGSRFSPWGFNYDHDRDGRLLEEYWTEEWETVVSDFREMKSLGANCVRIHLQFGLFMDAADQPNRTQLNQLNRLLKLADETGLYLNLTGLACYHRQHIPEWYDGLSEQDRWNAQAVFWTAIAETCRDHSAVFCFDLMNEPILPGKEPETEWLTGELSGKFFVQRISLDLKQRSRQEVAAEWVRQMTSAIRSVDRKRLITVGVIPWVFVFGGGKPFFYAPETGGPLDFVSIHFYPEAGKTEKALEALGAYDIGKPLVIEEMFPLKCSREEMKQFVTRSRSVADGWFGFYWGKTIDEYRNGKTIADAITADWLQLFEELTPQMTATGR